jgi:HlyD family secretion protein
MKRKKRKIHRHPVVFWSRIKLYWPLLVWIGAIALAYLLYSFSGRFGRLDGVVRVVRDEIAPIETARVLSVNVVPGQRVDAGDVLIQMDTSVLDAQLSIEKLQMERQFTREVQRLDETIRSLELRRAEDQAELNVLNGELKRMEKLLKQNLVDAQSVYSLRARKNILQETVARYPEMIAATKTERAAAYQRQTTLIRFLSGVKQGEEPQLEAKSLGLLQMRRDAFALRANRPGIVSRVMCEPYQVLSSGQEALTLIPDAPLQILGFLPESKAHEVKKGMSALISKKYSTITPVKATLIAIGPEVMALPGRISNIPGRRLRGLRLIFKLNEDMPLLPGETVSIHIMGTPANQKLIDFIRHPFRKNNEE